MRVGEAKRILYEAVNRPEIKDLGEALRLAVTSAGLISMLEEEEAIETIKASRARRSRAQRLRRRLEKSIPPGEPTLSRLRQRILALKGD